jgi:hypothetical protein
MDGKQRLRGAQGARAKAREKGVQEERSDRRKESKRGDETGEVTSLKGE